MNWYKQALIDGSASPPPYSRNDVIQEREDLAPSMLKQKERQERRKKRRDRRNNNNYNNNFI